MTLAKPLGWEVSQRWYCRCPLTGIKERVHLSPLSIKRFFQFTWRNHSPLSLSKWNSFSPYSLWSLVHQHQPSSQRHTCPLHWYQHTLHYSRAVPSLAHLSDMLPLTLTPLPLLYHPLSPHTELSQPTVHLWYTLALLLHHHHWSLHHHSSLHRESSPPHHWSLPLHSLPLLPM